MSVSRVLKLASLPIFALLAAPSAAQNTALDPNYETVTLTAGFEPDPRVISLRAGGNIDASNADSDCTGFITDAPDVRLHYESGSYPLILSVAANSDTTLVVNGPDGSWHCNDDGGEGSNPSIRLEAPESGRYEIWVGTYRSGNSQPARLHISEVSSQ